MPFFSAMLRSVMCETPSRKDARASETPRIPSTSRDGATTPYHWYLNFRCKNSRPHFGNSQSLLFPGATARTFSVSFPGTPLKYSRRQNAQQNLHMIICLPNLILCIETMIQYLLTYIQFKSKIVPISYIFN